MELNPILELNALPKEGMWYVLSGTGESPSMRVGHTASFVRPAGQVLVVGGANPGGAFAEHFRLCLKTLSWDRVDGPPQLGRYEHAAFQTDSRPHRVYAFGGAGADANRCDVVYVDVQKNGSAGKWKALSPLLAGEPPTPRTYHSGEAACCGDRLYVFSGGLAGAEAVPDQRVHRLSIGEKRWETLEVSGGPAPPGPRQGHVVVAMETALLVHGGMHNGEFFDSLHRFDLRRLVWATVSGQGSGVSGSSGAAPCARAGHGAVVWRQRMLVFGGLGRSGALNDLHSCDLETFQWTRIDALGDPPQPRLDFAICLCDIEIRPEREAAVKVPNRHDEASSESVLPALAAAAAVADGGVASGPAPAYLVTCLLVNGGMDTEGNIFDDTLTFPLAIRCLVSDDA